MSDRIDGPSWPPPDDAGQQPGRQPGRQDPGRPDQPPSGSPPGAAATGGDPWTGPPRYPTTPPPDLAPAGGPGGFLGALFDFSFHRFVTTRVVTFVYALVMVVAALYTLVLLAIGFRVNAGVGLLFLVVVCPLFFLLVVAVYRVLLELAVVVFRIHDNLDTLVRRGERG